MASLKVYLPNSIVLPEDSCVEKVFPRYSETSIENRSALDRKTIFFDVFYRPATNNIVAIGPDLLNLKHDLFPLEITLNGKRLSYKLTQIKGTNFLNTRVLQVTPLEPFEVVFNFSQFSITVLVDPKVHDAFCKFSKSCRLSLTTLQKDNPHEWISDWLKWHYRKYGTDRFILYDNDSTEREALIEFLKNLPLKMKIIFVDWPFPYGTDPYMFCQRGALNHTRLQFSVDKGYCINLDIDEFLMCSDRNLLEFLDSNLRYPTPGAVLVQQVIIPNIRSSKCSSLLRCWDFKYRYLVPGYQGEGKAWNYYGRTKYIFSYENVGYNAIHVTDSLKDSEYRKRYSCLSKILNQVKMILWESTKSLHRFKIPRPRIDAIYPKYPDICFFHFWGLDNGLRTNHVNRPVIDYDSKLHVLEPRISQIEMTVNENEST